jgi:hypothetical protein
VAIVSATAGGSKSSKDFLRAKTRLMEWPRGYQF